MTDTARLAQTVRILQVGSWEWDLASGEVTWSAELYRIFDLDESFTPTYETFVEHVHPDDRERVVGLVEGAVRTASPLEFEYRIVRHDATVRMMHCRGEVVSTDGRPVRVFGICQDVTERKRIRDEVSIGRELAFSVDAAAPWSRRSRSSWSGSAGTAASRSGRPGSTRLTSYLEFGAAWPVSDTPLAPFTERSQALTFEPGVGLPGTAWAARHESGSTT